MNPSTSKRKIAETVVGAAIGAAIAGPAGALAGGLAGSQVSAHTPPVAQGEPVQKTQAETFDPMSHAQAKRILVPLDFSASSRGALRFAREWASRFGSEVCLLHVVECMDSFVAFGAEPVAPATPTVDSRERVCGELEKLAREEFPNSIKVTSQIREGSAYDQILRAAADVDADLIIIATHGRTGFSHTLLGSTAERVVRHASCPVLTLRCGR